MKPIRGVRAGELKQLAAALRRWQSLMENPEWWRWGKLADAPWWYNERALPCGCVLIGAAALSSDMLGFWTTFASRSIPPRTPSTSASCRHRGLRLGSAHLP